MRVSVCVHVQPSRDRGRCFVLSTMHILTLLVYIFTFARVHIFSISAWLTAERSVLHRSLYMPRSSKICDVTTGKH